MIHDAASYPSAGQARRGLVCLAMIGFFLSMDITLTTLLIEPMKQDLGLTDIQIGLLQGTAFGLAFGLSSMPFGRLIDRSNRVRLLGRGLLCWIVAMMISGVANSFAILVLARVILGMVAALLIPAALSLVADFFPPEKRSVATSMFVVGQAGGQAFGVLAGGFAFDAFNLLLADHAGTLPDWPAWRFLFIGAASLGLAPILFLVTLHEPARQEQKERSMTARDALRALWSYRHFLLPLIAAMLFVQIMMQAAAVWAPPVLTRRFGLTPGQFAGWLSVIMLAGGMLGAVAGGRLGEAGRRHGRSRVLMPAMIAALAMMPFSLFGLAPTVTVLGGLLAGNILAGAVIATLGVVAITLNIPNEIRGLALGGNVLCSTLLGTATAPAAIALVSQALGGEEMLGMAIASLCIPAALLAALCFLLAMRSERAIDSPVGPTLAPVRWKEAD